MSSSLDILRKKLTDRLLAYRGESFSNEELDLLLNEALLEFNLTPWFTNFSFDDVLKIDGLSDKIVDFSELKFLWFYEPDEKISSCDFDEWYNSIKKIKAKLSLYDEIKGMQLDTPSNYFK